MGDKDGDISDQFVHAQVECEVLVGLSMISLLVYDLFY